jgi:hypothetical protein
MSKVSNPIPIYIDGRGALLDAGSIYIGEANKDPLLFPVAVFFDSALTIPAAQPLRTLSGVIVNGQNVVTVFTAADDYSMLILDADGLAVGGGYIASTQETASVDYQPLDSDLTAIAALSTTAYGRALLTLANTAALKTATGIPDCLPLTGGTVSGSIVRTGAGVHAYHADAAMTGGRIFLTATGAADPTSLPGDIWLTY